MKISPIDIRQHTFEKGFRGYDVDDVNAFLNSLSQEWERVLSESKMLKMQLEIAEKELNKLRDVEMTLFRTLKTAEETSIQITEQANKAAEKYLEESRRKTDETIADTNRKAAMIVQDAENEAKYVREEIINELKNQERDFKAMEKYRDNVVVQLKSLVSNTNETVERFEKKFSQDSSFAQKMEEIKQQVTEAANRPALAEENAERDENEVAAAYNEAVADDLNETNHNETGTNHNETETNHNETEMAENTADEINVAVDEENTQEETRGENQDSDTQNAKGQDAAAEALAEVEKMVKARKAAEALKISEGTNDGEATAEESKGKGSFFDQIG